MSLRQKFAFLVGLLALSAVVSAGAAWWSVRLLERELAQPFSRITSALTDLNRTKRDVWEQARLMLGESAGSVPIPESEASGVGGQQAGGAAARFAALHGSLQERLDALEQNDAFLARAGVSAWRTLRERLERAESDAAAWWSAGDEAARTRAASELLVVHELLERSEAGVLRDAELASDYGARLRRLVTVALGFALATAALVASFAFLRLRRWVLRPVSELRTAASRIAQGDFAHRLPVTAPAAGSPPPRDELTRLALEVNHMAGMVSALQEERVARERMAAMGEMMRRVAHNIRNPLSGIRALAEMSRGELAPGTETRESQERIIATVDRFESWLADAIASAGPLDVRPAPHEVGPWLRHVAETLAPMAEARRVRLVVDASRAPATAEFDARHLEHALVALLTNAIQASPPDGSVTLASATNNGDGWSLSVADEGPGVPDELLPRIFDAHFTTKRAGTGMGLALCRQIVREHGGAVGVKASLAASEGVGAHPRGPGAVFVIDLPLEPRR